MFAEFRKFLLQTNALALAIGVIIGAAVGKVVGSIVDDVLMPLIGLLIPGGSWREAKWVLATRLDGAPASAITYGSLLGALVDFVIIALVVFLITRALLKPAASAPMRPCPECREVIPLEARRCRACTSPAPA